jgi:decaprenylphospho-beta-D-ribofuranose 2-oxidase
MSRRLLTGWGRTAPTGADVVAPVGVGHVAGLVAAAGSRGTLARGLGRSYGDAATNAGGAVLDARPLRGVDDFDPDAGTVTAEAGLSLDELMRLVVPWGWFPLVTPGTRHVTLGGALAADIHGKNHHRDGSFAAGVRWFDLVAPGWRGRVEPGDDAFDATVGGMGLTGVVTRMALDLQPIPTSRMVVDTERTADLDDLLARLEHPHDDHRYSVAWIDLMATGSALGRGVLTRGEHAPVEALPGHERPARLDFDPRALASAPPWVPGGLLNRLTVRAFNEAWYRMAPEHRTGELQSIPAFFHPLDGVRGWNRVYGPRGFLQYQFVLPPEASELLRQIVADLAAAAVPSFLAVLKRFGPGGSGHLSFPMEGWTLALDIPTGVDGLEQRLRRHDEAIAAAGGRVYLAKDSRLAPDLLPAMYPRLDEWRQVRDRLDPDRVMQSDLDRRLDLTGH